MSDLVILTCPNCGGKIEITKDIDHLKCKYCGMEHTIDHQEGTVFLVPVIQTADTGDDPVSSELVIQKLEEEITDLKKVILEITNQESYKKNVFYGITLGVSLLFTLASLLAWSEFRVTMWIVFFIVGICVIIISGIAVRLQAMEFSEQSKKLYEMVNPYQIALERKQKELAYQRAVAITDKKQGDQ